MLAWWVCQNNDQELLSLETVFEIEHIYAKSRYNNEKSLTDPKTLEALGNKALLERRINIRASDYRFMDKKKYYTGFTNNRNQRKEGSKNHELLTLANSSTDFVEADIENRTDKILNSFADFLSSNDLLA